VSEEAGGSHGLKCDSGHQRYWLHAPPVRARCRYEHFWIGALSRKIKCYRMVEVHGSPPAFVGRNPASSRRRLDVAGKESQRQHNPEEPNSHQ
jgi:hypothetical protein